MTRGSVWTATGCANIGFGLSSTRYLMTNCSETDDE